MLAVYGIDTDGKLYIHVKIYKQRRVFGELIIKNGEVNILCRDCYRWHTIKMTGRTASLHEMQNPPAELNAGQ